MAKRSIYILLIILLVIVGYIYWSTHRDTFGSGDVKTSDTSARMDSGNVDLDGKPMPEGGQSSLTNNAADTGAASTKSNSTAATGTTGAPVATGAVATPMAQPAPAMAMPVSSPAVVQPPMTNMTMQPDLPTGDTLSASAPAGMAFGGSGKFQWYRQGNLTWRINTQSGSSCVAFATMDEWQKPIVYQHGCGNA